MCGLRGEKCFCSAVTHGLPEYQLVCDATYVPASAPSQSETLSTAGRSKPVPASATTRIGVSVRPVNT